MQGKKCWSSFFQRVLLVLGWLTPGCCLEPLAKSSRMLGEKNKIFDFCHDASANTCFLSWLSCRCQQPDVQIHQLAWKPATKFPVGFFLMKLQVVSAFSTLSIPCLCFLLHGNRSCLLFLFKMADYRADMKIITFSMVLTQASALCTNQGNLQCFVAVFGSYKAVNALLDCSSQSSCWVGQCWQPAACCLVSFPTIPAATACLQPFSHWPLSLLSRRGAEQMDAFPIVTATCSFPSALICCY